jgi:hypothetical protein
MIFQSPAAKAVPAQGAFSNRRMLRQRNDARAAVAIAARTLHISKRYAD